MKRAILSMLTVAMVLISSCNCGNTNSRLVEREDWADDVKTAVNDFIELYGNQSKNYDENSYVVSDFDNTASIFDTYEQFMVYQAEVMGYGFTPAELPAILASGLGDLEEDLSGLGYGKGSYNNWISDITAAYTYLYNTYGPFKPGGVDTETAKIIQSDPMWAEFAAKIMNMYYLVSDNESLKVSYPWVTYRCAGLTEQEVYDLARAAFAKYKRVPSRKKQIKSPETIVSNVGETENVYVEGIQVTENIKELWQALEAAGIDVWICSATQSDVIRAAVDEFGLHDCCTGLIGMTPAIVDGKIGCTYDYKTGYPWFADDDGGWHQGDVASGAQTQGVGKVKAVENICVKEYGCAPLAGFMDSTGDYGFCTEYKNLKLVVCFNRADRKVTDGGSVIAELAIYQRNELGYNLEKANSAGDTLYVLQGRDENGYRTFRNSNETVLLGTTTPKLFRDEQNYAIYSYSVRHKLSTEEIINTFAIKTAEDDKGNALGFEYGFLEEYDGYHSRGTGGGPL